MELKDRVCVVTGGAQGIGLAMRQARASVVKPDGSIDWPAMHRLG
ncbi:MAG: hypothetical protein ACLGI7_08840 [Gammaproteobacteria bacterium]